MEFVTFEMAKKLKEKGFKYNKNNLLDRLCMENQINHPSIHQVLKWLREEKKIHISIDIYDDGWFIDITSFYKKDTGVYEIELPYRSSKVTPDYDSFEQAAVAGIEYVLDNLKL